MRVLDQARIRDLAARDPRWNEAVLNVEPAGAGLSILRDVYAQPLMILMAIVTLLLLLACTNIASLLLARGSARRREMAVRVALGAGRWRIVRQGLTEALLLSSFGTLLGIFVAYWGVQALLAVLQSGPVGALLMPVALQVSVEPDGRVLFFTAGVALLTGVLFGVAPIVDTMAFSPAASLSEARIAGETRSRRVFGKSLVVAQVAFSLVLLSAAGLFIRHVANLRNADLGFEPDSVLLVTLNPRGSGFGRAALSSRYRDLLGHLEAIPGVHSATIAGATPIEGAAASAFVDVTGFQERPGERRRSMLNWVGPRYFETFGTPVVAGREFQFEDAERPGVAIVNQATVRHYLADRNPIGQRVTVEHLGAYEIVGVVADAKYTTLREPAPRTVYLNAFQQGRIVSQFALRTDVAPTVIVPDVRRLVRDRLNAVSIANVTTLTEQVDRSIVTERVLAWLSGWFGAVGALLAAIGLYGLLAYTVARRRHEIGVRMSLGATPGAILGMVVKGAAGLVAFGLALGIPVAWWSQRVAASVLGDLPAASLPVGLASGALIIVALLAAWLPARRASYIGPVEALRHE
jgi:predicted permease